MKRWLPVLLSLLLLILMHLPFLGADPDTEADMNTRGAWTDEGLYSSQARNTLNGYGFDVKENTTAVRGPLQYYLQTQVMGLLGQERVVLRILTLFFVVLAILAISGAAGPVMGMLLALTGFLQFHLFQFSHYAMAEMMAVSLILISLAFLAWMLKLKLKHWYLWMFLSAVALMAAVAMKVQYAYIAMLMPVLVWAFSLGGLGPKPWPFRITSLALISGLALGLWMLWFQPNLEYFRHVMSAESSGRFGETIELMFRISKYNVLHSFWIPELQPLIVSAGLSLLLLPFLRKKAPSHLWMLAMGALFWLILELHKLPMRYLPNRYLLSTFMPLALLSSSVILMLWEKQDLRRFLLIPILACLSAWNIYYNYTAFARRTFELRETNEYLNARLPDSALVMGPWAASLTWGSQARTLPVWDSYAADTNLLELYQPDLVITEFNHADSDSAWHRRGCDPAAIADSSYSFRLWRMELTAWWMPKQKIEDRE